MFISPSGGVPLGRSPVSYTHLRAHRPNGISISSAIFALMTAECPYTLQWDALPPLKIAPSYGGSGPPIQYILPWAHPSPQHKRHLDWFSRFCGAHYCHVRQTDRPRNSVTIGRIYVRSTARWPKNQQLIVSYDKRTNNKALYKIHHLYFKQQFKQS